MKDLPIFDTIEGFFIADDWDFRKMDDVPVLSMGFTGRNGNWTCIAEARELQCQFVFYSIMPVNAPEDCRADIAEFITRANYGMPVGNFEMDYTDGEIRFKTSIDVEGGELTPALFRQVVYTNVILTDRYLPGVMSVIYGGKHPMDAVDEIEDVPDSDDDHDGEEDFPDLSGLDFSFLDDDEDDDTSAGDKLN